MLGIVDLPVFVGAVFLLNVTPGPDTAYIVGRSISQGRAAGMMSALGTSAGSCVHTLATAFGLTAILAASAAAFTVIKVLGAAYLIYLGVRMLFARPETAAQPAESATPRSLRALFLQGFWTNVLNPKVILFFLSFFPQFVDPHSTQRIAAFLVLGAVMVTMSTLWNATLVWLAGSVTRRVGRAPGVKRWVDRVVGTAFVGLGVRLATVTR